MAARRSFTSESDDELVERYRDGERAALEELFRRHERRVYRFARHVVGEHAAEEVLQETFLALARAADRYEGRGQFVAWLMRIARNFCLNQVSAQEVRRRQSDPEARLDDLPTKEARPDAVAELGERLELLERAIERLPVRQREAVVMSSMQMSYREIAMVMEVPINTVKTLIHRGRAALAREIEE